MWLRNFLRTYVGPAITIFASICSIASLALLFVNHVWTGIVALVVFCLGLIVLLCRILHGINQLVCDNSEEEYKKISSTFIYQSSDGVKSTFEVSRSIQCKRVFLTEIPYSFKWTGSTKPKIESRIHSLVNISHNQDKNCWDNAVVRFNHPLRYNECTVINVKIETDDVDGSAKPWISSRLDSPIEMLTYRILLAYKDCNFNSPAVFERKMISSQIDRDYEVIGSVPFDKEHKSYYYCYTNPEPGYIYRIRWEK